MKDYLIRFYQNLIRFHQKKINEMEVWARQKNFGLFIFSLVLVLLLLLRSAGYFEPYFPLSVNFIILISFILSTILLGAKSQVMFLIALGCWLFAAFLKFLGIDVWMERTAIYSFEAIVVGVLLLIIETIRHE